MILKRVPITSPLLIVAALAVTISKPATVHGQDRVTVAFGFPGGITKQTDLTV